MNDQECSEKARRFPPVAAPDIIKVSSVLEKNPCSSQKRTVNFWNTLHSILGKHSVE